MHAADAVLSGGVRRSATICLFSPTDEEMMTAKTGNWFIDNPQRGRSNNSAVIVRDEAKKEEFAKLMESVKSFGEPGFVFVESTEHTTNPCVEIGMYPQIDGKSGWQGCNLTEINGGMCKTEEDFYKACRAGAILGTVQAGYTDFKFLGPDSKKIFDREALLGVSITGWMNQPDILFNPKILEKGAKIVKEVNKEVAAIIGINPAARTTCVKPSGNASVLLQTASGIHAEHSPTYIRNVQMNKESEITQAIIKSNPYMVEESVWSASGTDVVVSFPIIPHKGSMMKDELLGVTHLDKVKLAQKHWVVAGTNEELCADKGIRHNVSNTILVDDWAAVEQYVFKNRHSFSGISFLSMSGDKDYNQAPNTAVINAKQMVKQYDEAAIFASGLVVDALKAYPNLWDACSTAQGFGMDISLECAENAARADWNRRFENFANNYLERDVKRAEHCLKDAYLLHKWNKIQANLKPIEWNTGLTEKKYTDVDTIAAASCAGGACEIDF
jgi:ribonucleoside-diphosphate reductase alpha chain